MGGSGRCLGFVFDKTDAEQTHTKDIIMFKAKLTRKEDALAVKKAS